MTRRHIHYEAAFEDLLRATGTPYVAVDEAKRAIFAGARIGSFDFLVYRPDGTGLFVDVKGRKFPYITRSGRRYWENWVPREDLDHMDAWDRVLADKFTGLFVFAYWLTGPEETWPIPESQIHSFREEQYAFLAVAVADYRKHCRARSAKWDTVSVPVATFRKLVVPMTQLLTKL